MPFYPFLGECSPTKIFSTAKIIGYPYSNLSNLEDLGGTSLQRGDARLSYARYYSVKAKPVAGLQLRTGATWDASFQVPKMTYVEPQNGAPTPLSGVAFNLKRLSCLEGCQQSKQKLTIAALRFSSRIDLGQALGRCKQPPWQPRMNQLQVENVG